MSEKFKIVYDEQLNILFKNYYGNITIADIILSWDKVIKNNMIPKTTKGFLLDYTNAKLDVKVKDYAKIPEYYKRNLSVFGGLKFAILTQNIEDVIVPSLVQLKDKGYLSKPFYTREAAIAWLVKKV